MRWPLPWPKAWRQGAPPKEEEPEGEEKPPTARESAILFARDLAVAFLIVAIVMGLLFAYTSVWPPMVVVESDSMQHSDTGSSVGVIDTGDLVLVQAVHQPSDITTYLEGNASGASTYSNFGDVIVFHKPFASLEETPIIHRAIAYVVPNALGGMDVPALSGHPNGTDWTGRLANGSWPVTATRLVSLTLLRVHSWHINEPSVAPFTWDLAGPGFRNAGFLTKGDHNPNGDSWSAPVAVTRVIGKARGELPWFGLIKLTLAPGSTGCCPRGWGDTLAPKNSWDSLLVALVAIVVGPFAADYGWAFYIDWRKAKRKAAPTTAPTTAEDPLPDAAGIAAPDGDSPTDAPLEVTDETRTESSGPEGDGPEVR